MTSEVTLSEVELNLLGQLALELPNFVGSQQFAASAVSESTLHDCVAGVFLIETYYRALLEAGVTPLGLLLGVHRYESLMVYARPSIEGGVVRVGLSPKSIKSLTSLLGAAIEWLEVLGDVNIRTGSTSERLRALLSKIAAIAH
jgi:hypothetical protein